MIKSISFERYRKLKNITLNFSKGVNAISGTNGTCKSSVLYLISNAFQEIDKRNFPLGINAFNLVKKVNKDVNTKIESLVRGDKKYNDPAPKQRGVLFSVEYFDGVKLGFRRHNSRLKEASKKKRYSLKPEYKDKNGEKLPILPVVYLGLSRLHPFGEFNNDKDIKKIKGINFETFTKGVIDKFNAFTHYGISDFTIEQMGKIKNRANFSSEIEGVDSYTISAGEDNLISIFQALESLKYYYESIQSSNPDGIIDSVLLIDELDATLHPAYQNLLLKVFRDYSEKYKIQIIFTTHSLYLLDEMLKEKDNVIYLIDNIKDVQLMPAPTIQGINVHLKTITKDAIYRTKNILIFTEDEEARWMLELIFEYWESLDSAFRSVRRYFHLINANFGAKELEKLFKDKKITLDAICVLDGDHQQDLSFNIACLPGKDVFANKSNLSPEALLFSYVEYLYQKEDDDFFNNQEIMSEGFTKRHYTDNIKPDVDEVNNLCNDCTDERKKGEIRKKRKKIFNDISNDKNNPKFFEYVFKHWLYDKKNSKLLDNFYDQIYKLFFKVAEHNGISKMEWKKCQEQ